MRNFKEYHTLIQVTINNLILILKSVLSDPDKRKKYDKYGTVDEDDWNYQDFMKNMNFEDIFTVKII